MVKIKLIPVSEIESGIKTCINKSELLLKAAEKLYSCNYVDEAVVMYYYAVEEFGKGVILKKRKNDAISQHKLDIDVSDFFYEHDVKIEAARSEAGKEIDIMEYNLPPEDGQFHQLTEKGRFVDDFKERSSLLLTDYDPATRKWGKILSIPVAYQTEKAFAKLHDVLNNWKK